MFFFSFFESCNIFCVIPTLYLGLNKLEIKTFLIMSLLRKIYSQLSIKYCLVTHLMGIKDNLFILSFRDKVRRRGSIFCLPQSNDQLMLVRFQNDVCSEGLLSEYCKLIEGS